MVDRPGESRLSDAPTCASLVTFSPVPPAAITIRVYDPRRQSGGPPILGAVADDL